MWNLPVLGYQQSSVTVRQEPEAGAEAMLEKQIMYHKGTQHAGLI